MNELERVYERLLVITTFLDSRMDQIPALGNGYLKTLLASVKAKSDPKALHSVASEMNTWINHLETEDRTELAALLRAKGFKLPNKTPKLFHRILARNRIENISEYRLVHDTLSDCELTTKLVNKANKLLNEYEGSFDE